MDKATDEQANEELKQIQAEQKAEAAVPIEDVMIDD